MPAVVKAGVRECFLLLMRWCILHCLSTTTISLIIRRHQHHHQRHHRRENVNWCESVAVTTTTTVVMRMTRLSWRACSANCVGVGNGQTHRHSRQHHRGAGPVKSDEEGHLIYRDGDILFERCTQHHHHFFVAVTLQLLLPSLHCTGTNRFFSYHSKTLYSDNYSSYIS